MTDSKPAKAPASKAPKAPAASKAAATPPAPPAPPTPPAPPAPQPYAQQQPYGGVAYQPGMGPKTNTLSIVALILAFFVPLGGIICGHIALNQIKKTGEAGHGLALAGTVIGYVLFGLGLLFGIFYIIFFAALFSSGVLEPGTVI
jgi:hypothetical protein